MFSINKSQSHNMNNVLIILFVIISISGCDFSPDKNSKNAAENNIKVDGSLQEKLDSLPIICFETNFKTMKYDSACLLFHSWRYPFSFFINKLVTDNVIVYSRDSVDFNMGPVDFCSNPTILKFICDTNKYNIDSLYTSVKVKCKENLFNDYVWMKCGYLYCVLHNEIYFILENGCSSVPPFDSIRSYLKENQANYLWIKCGIVMEDYIAD